jgi:hypothetical protein
MLSKWSQLNVELTLGTHCTGGWVGLRAGLDTEATGEIRFLCRGLNHGRPVCSRTPLDHGHLKTNDCEKTISNPLPCHPIGYKLQIISITHS